VNQAFIGGASAPCGVAADAAHVYWTNSDSGTIGRANLDGTGVDQSFITGLNAPCGVAVDGAHVYWTNVLDNGGGIGRATLDGTGVDESFVAGLAAPLAVAVDDAHLYWADQGAIERIGRANLDGTGVDRNFIDGGALRWWASAPTTAARAPRATTQQPAEPSPSPPVRRRSK
jgi:virginiamycin B lyase